MSYVCVICEESLSFKDSINGSSSERQINATNCGHVFHSSCLNEWFETQKRKQSQSYNPQQQLNKTTCPSCQRQVNPNMCLRIYLTEENTLDNAVPISGIETKAELKKEIVDLKAKVEFMGARHKEEETLFINTLQMLSMEKEALEFDYQQLESKLASKGKNLSGGSTESVASEEESTGSSDLNERNSPEPEPIASSSTSYAQMDKIIPLTGTKGGLRLKDKVVWMHEEISENGSVLWLGEINGAIFAGIEFENPIGNASGIPVINGKKAFSGKPEYSRMVPVKELILYIDFYGSVTDSDSAQSEQIYHGATLDIDRDLNTLSV